MQRGSLCETPKFPRAHRPGTCRSCALSEVFPSRLPQGGQPGDPKCARPTLHRLIQISGEEGERLSLRAWDEHMPVVRVPIFSISYSP